MEATEDLMAPATPGPVLGPPEVQVAQTLSRATPTPSPESLGTWSQAGTAPPRTGECEWEIPNWTWRAPILLVLSHELKVSNSLRPERDVNIYHAAGKSPVILPTIHKTLIPSGEASETQNLSVLLKDI